jgi:hypothetical protein
MLLCLMLRLGTISLLHAQLIISTALLLAVHSSLSTLGSLSLEPTTRKRLPSRPASVGPSPTRVSSGCSSCVGPTHSRGPTLTTASCP